MCHARRYGASLQESGAVPNPAARSSTGKQRTPSVQDGQTLITDGPFADTKEVFGGYYGFEADSLDGVLEVAARIPAARMGGCVEVRPLVERQS
jgi:hypothetical protein